MRLGNIGPNVLWHRRLTLQRVVMVLLTEAPNQMLPSYCHLFAERRGSTRLGGRCIQQYELDAAVVVVPQEGICG